MSNRAFVLESIEIQDKNRYVYGRKTEDAVLYEGTVKFRGSDSKISLHLDDQLSRAVVLLLSEQLVESSKALAGELTGDILGTINALPAPENNHDSDAETDPDAIPF